MTKAQEAERQEALARLREWLKPGDTVYTILRHVSRSGMQRTIELVIFGERIEHSQPRGTTDLHIGWNVAKVLDMRYDCEREGIKIGGAGMDMGFALVYELSTALWPKGVPCTGEGCLSNDHNNDPRGPRGEGVLHRDGGYALRQRWL